MHSYRLINLRRQPSVDDKPHSKVTLRDPLRQEHIILDSGLVELLQILGLLALGRRNLSIPIPYHKMLDRTMRSRLIYDRKIRLLYSATIVHFTTMGEKPANGSLSS